MSSKLGCGNENGCNFWIVKDNVKIWYLLLLHMTPLGFGWLVDKVTLKIMTDILHYFADIYRQNNLSGNCKNNVRMN